MIPFATLQPQCHSWTLRVTLSMCGIVLSMMLAVGQAQEDDQAELAANEQRQKQIAARFLTVLEQNPRRGTALERVYAHHVEFGTLNSFLEELRQRTKREPEDGLTWMLLGLFEAHRGDDAAAVAALQQAVKLRPEDALTAYYLGQSELLSGRPDDAVKSLELALTREPDRNDLLEIYEQLGRIHQRLQRDAEALAIWTRLEALFPEDPRVLEQIARSLTEEGEYASALTRFEKLIQLTRDEYRKSTFRMEAAQIKTRLNRRAEAIADFENLLADLNPEGWLFREVRQKIEAIFLNSADQDGLVKYYESWMTKHPDDIDVMARLAKNLAAAARMPEALNWIEKALTRAPDRIELRRVFIQQLIETQNFAEAARQYELVAASAPSETVVLRDWGKLKLRDQSVSLEERQAAAKRIWNRILEVRPDDALTTSQVADLYRHAGMSEEAIQLYEKAISLAPNDPQYREYLGEYLHRQNRNSEAFEVWKQIVAEPRRTAENLSRLSEVLTGFGFHQESLSYVLEAAKLDPKDLPIQMRAADALQQAERFEEALASLNAAEALTESDDERESVLVKQMETLQAAGKLNDAINEQAAVVAGQKSKEANAWLRLARLQQYARQHAPAAESIQRAIELDPKSIPVLTTAVTIAEAAGNVTRAVELSRKLADLDRRSRGDHLMSVARLQAQLGQSEQALATGREVILSAPGNTDHYEFYAQLCNQFGKREEAIEALRKAMRINPAEPHLMTALAAALANQFHVDEAIEIYWRAFEKSDDVSEKVSLTTKLTELHLQLNQLDRMLERLRRDQREEEQRRAATICLAQAHQTAGDFGSARQELESLLTQETRDTELLQQLSKLCEQSQDNVQAANYQRQLVAIAPGAETEGRLAQLLYATGEVDAAAEIYQRLIRGEEDPIRRLKGIDALINASNYEAVLGVTEPLLRNQRDNWELLYRDGVALVNLKKFPEAKERFQQILSLDLPLGTVGAIEADRIQKQQAKNKSNNLKGLKTSAPTAGHPLDALGFIGQARAASGLVTTEYYGNRNPQTWTPGNYSTARLATWAWLLSIAESQKSKEDFVQPVRERALAAQADPAAIYDAIYLLELKMDHRGVFELSKLLVSSGGEREQQFYLQSLMLRSVSPTISSGLSPARLAQDPLSDDEVDLMLKCYEEQRSKRSANGMAVTRTGSQFLYSSNGMLYVMLSSGGYYPVSNMGAQVQQIADELKRVGREEQAEQLISRELMEAKTVQQLSSAISLALETERSESLPDLEKRWLTALRARLAPSSNSFTPTREVGAAMQSTMTLLIELAGEEKDYDKALQLLESGIELCVAENRAVLAAAAKQKNSPGSARAVSSRQPLGQVYVSFYVGKKQTNIRVDYPRPNEYFSREFITLLRQAYETCKRNDVLSDLEAFLVEGLQKSTVEKKLYWHQLLGAFYWWCEDFNLAIDQISAFSKSVPDDLQYQLEFAELLTGRGRHQEAMDIVESLNSTDQKLLQRRELLTLELAEQLGDRDRARVAAERLFGMRLDSATSTALAERMRRLGMNELAESVAGRMQRQGGNDLSSLVEMMRKHQGGKNNEMARQVAFSILQRTARPNSLMNNRTRNRGTAGADQNARTQAMDVLVQTGAAGQVIERLEEQLQRSPDSVPLRDQLVEYYQAAKQTDKLILTLEKGLELRPDLFAFRYALAQAYQSKGQRNEACDQYLILMKQAPEWFMEDFHQVLNSFQAAKRMEDLGDVMAEIDLKKFPQPYNVINVASNLLQSEASMNVGVTLMVRCYEEFPQYRQQVLSQFHNTKAWTNPKIQELALKMLIPDRGVAVAQPWYGLDQINLFQGNGIVSGVFHRMVESTRNTDRATTLQKRITNAVEENPEWLAGQAMLGIFAIKNGKSKEGIATLTALLEKQKSLEEIPYATAWMIGQEIDSTEQGRDLALKLYENAMKRDDANHNQFENSLSKRILNIYLARGERDKARDVLLAALKPNTQNYDPNYQRYQNLQTKLVVCKQLLDMNCAGDAARLYYEIVANPDEMKAASLVFGNNSSMTEQWTRQIRDGLKAVEGKLASQDPVEALDQLLVDPTSRKSVPKISLILPDSSGKEMDLIHSPLLIVLAGAVAKEETRGQVEKHLATLLEVHTESLAPRLLICFFQLLNAEMDVANTQQSLRELVAYLEAHPLEIIPEQKRINSRQLAAATEMMSVWLVARDCLKKPDLKDLGRDLAAKAVAAAERQRDPAFLNAMLLEWGQISLSNEDRQEAEKNWSQLLDLSLQSSPLSAETSTSQSDSSSQGASPEASQGVVGTPAKTSSPVSKNQPRTLSQFRIAMHIAKHAAKNEMPGLSLRAVSESISEGLPISNAISNSPDAITQQIQGNGNPIFPQPYAIASDQQVVESISPDEVAKEVREVIKLWKSSDYDPNAVRLVLEPLVFPADRPAEVRVFHSSPKSLKDRSESLGSLLVEWESKANRLPELQKMLSERLAQAKDSDPIHVLQVHVALAEEDMEAARQGLKLLEKAITRQENPASVDLVADAAMAASQIEELKKDAEPILRHVARSQIRKGPKNQKEGALLWPLQKALEWLY